MMYEQPNPNWNASWLWHPGTSWKVNDHFFARREFSLPGPATSAVCRISAYTDYVLYLNGKYVGRGPVPCDPTFQSYDTHDVTSFLQEGKNAIAVLAHNYAIGVHWQYRNQGGLIAQLDIETAGKKITVGTDDAWRVKSADCYADNSPRQFWSCGFMETFDFRKFDDRWTNPGFDDSDWSPPEVFGPHPAKPWTRLVPRDIPRLRETLEPVVGAEKGTFSLQKVHAVRFDKLLPPGREGIVYAQTAFHSDDEKILLLHLECDDACKLILNGQVVSEKNYSQHFARTRVWRARDEYQQVHYAMGAPGQKIKITLKKGWNTVLLAIDHGSQGWGFALAPLDPGTLTPVPVKYSPEGWTLAGPIETTGADDSLNAVETDLTHVKSLHRYSYDPFDYEGITDYATLMRYEHRGQVQSVSAAQPISLRAGEFCILDLGVVHAGFPRLTIRSEGEGILDVGCCQLFHADRAIRFSNNGDLKYVDRVYTRPGRQEWQPLHRRTARFIHISCRKGSIEILNPAINTIGYPVENIAAFKCSDPALNRIWDVSRYTTALLMQYGYQDCLKREQGTFNTSSFNYMSRAAACCFGDYDLARRAFRLAFRLQDETGWFHSHGLSSPNCDEHVECLWLLVWLKDFYLYSGDREFIRECFDGVEDNLRYFSRSLNQYGLLDERNNPVFRQGQIIYLDDSLSPSEGYVGRFDGEVSGINIMYYAALKAVQFLAQELGHTDREAHYARISERLKRSFNLRFWNPALNRIADNIKNDTPSTTGHPILQIAALYFDICDDDKQVSLLHYLEHDLGLPEETKPDYPLYTFGFYYYFLEILFRNDRPDLAYRLLNLFYGRWLELVPTTFGEFFKPGQYKGQKTTDIEYEVHGYGTSAHLHFYNNILGIRPAAPGFAEVLIKPCPGNLTFAKGSIHSPQGKIAVDWTAHDSTFTLNLNLPASCNYQFELPKQFTKTNITVNGAPLTARLNGRAKS